ncbi:serine hydrolase [Brevundimonas sp. PAMC22021]|uniref:serine hydrolase n=1 Tax=Brevundimonas sp. PAMC22021 TaxID=2861285 RepID=UPI002102F393|nr:serine hydrolase [Brevundimonas sp. PAMC22021]
MAALGALTLVSAPAAAQDVARMDQVVRASAERDAFSGAVLVAKNGDVLLDQGYGLANREWSIPNDSQTKFRLGSLTKQFTAVAILMLADQGKVDLDAPIKTLLPGSPAAWDTVTVRHLLSHTSGVPDFTRQADYEALKTRPTKLASLIARFSSQPLAFPPGERFSYSNSGYILLSAVIEAASGQPYADFVTSNLFQPLGMSDSGYDRHDVITPRRASGYASTAGGVINADYVDMSIPQGAGALFSTTRDLLKWEQGLFSGRLLSETSMDALTTPVRDGYAMGLVVSRSEGRTLIWHNGGIEGFNTYMAYDPDDRFAVIVLGNLNGEAPDKIGNDLTTLMRGGAVTLASERRSIVVAPDVLQSYVGVYELAPGFDLTFSVVDGALMAQATGQQANRLRADATDAFFLEAVDAEIVFTRDPAGAVQGVVLHQGGRDMPGRKR